MILWTSQANILRHALIQRGHGTLPSASLPWPVWAEKMGDLPNEAMVVMDVGGILHGRDMRTGETVENLGVQIILRYLDPLVGWKKAYEVAADFDSIITPITISIAGIAQTYKVGPITRSSPIMALGAERKATNPQEEDTRGRRLVSMNFLCTIGVL